MRNKYRLRLALGVLSGRLSGGQGLHAEDWYQLGFDTSKFSYYGAPTDPQLRSRGEEIIFEAITATWPEEED